MTNFEKIKQMTVEGMAEFLVSLDVEAMCEDYRNGAGYAQLSRKYGISVSATKRMLVDAGEIQYTTRSEMERERRKRET